MISGGAAPTCWAMTSSLDLQDARGRLNELDQKIGTLREELNSGRQALAAQRATDVA